VVLYLKVESIVDSEDVRNTKFVTVKKPTPMLLAILFFDI
jgi:hypothetical protein